MMTLLMDIMNILITVVIRKDKNVCMFAPWWDKCRTLLPSRTQQPLETKPTTITNTIIIITTTTTIIVIITTPTIIITTIVTTTIIVNIILIANTTTIN